MNRISILALSLSIAAFVSGCINLPQTKALVTPVGAIGFHNFGPPKTQPRDIDLAPPDQRVASAEEERSN
jgi:hypothetical protein